MDCEIRTGFLGDSNMAGRLDLRSLARLGAQERLHAIRVEMDGLLKQFPGLQRGSQATANGVTAGPRTRKMSAAGRKRIADAAKKRWAEWRKQQGKG
jgi:hypothetical protein